MTVILVINLQKEMNTYVFLKFTINMPKLAYHACYYYVNLKLEYHATCHLRCSRDRTTKSLIQFVFCFLENSRAFMILLRSPASRDSLALCARFFDPAAVAI